MSELKVYHCNEWHNEYTEFYMKNEADKVIAELENRIDEGDKEFDVANEQNERLLKIVRHHKYKRCLAMAKLCGLMSAFHNGEWYTRWINRWYYRWLELADKFKEAK